MVITALADQNFLRPLGQLDLESGAVVTALADQNVLHLVEFGFAGLARLSPRSRAAAFSPKGCIGGLTGLLASATLLAGGGVCILERLEAHYNVTTPMFSGGANHAPEFRLASFANLARWWWRFLALSRYGDDDLAGFWEAVLFGWHKAPFGQKRVSFRLPRPPEGLSPPQDRYPEPWEPKDFETVIFTDKKGNEKKRSGSWLEEHSGISYLNAQAFQVDQTTKILPRHPVHVRSFDVEIRFIGERGGLLVDAGGALHRAWQKRHGSAADASYEDQWQTAKTLLSDALKALGLMGGMGARSRRGFGSLAIRTLKSGDSIWNGPANRTDYEVAVQAIMDRFSAFQETPRYTAGSAKTEHCFFPSPQLSGDVRSVWNQLGSAFQIYRSYGQKDKNTPSQHQHRIAPPSRAGGGWAQGGTRKIAAQLYRPKFQEDHDGFYIDAKNVWPNSGGKPSSVPNRVVFGMPHAYGNANTTVGWNIEGAKDAERRRASPLFFHVHSFSDDSACALVFVVPASFLPDPVTNSYSVNYSVLRARQNQANLHLKIPVSAVQLPDFSLLTGFFDFLGNPNVLTLLPALKAPAGSP